MQQPGDITVPGRKLLDIFKALPEKTQRDGRDGRRSGVDQGGKIRFTLSTLPAAEFPVVDEINAQQTLTLAPGRVPTFDRQDALFDGSAGRSLLFERTCCSKPRANRCARSPRMAIAWRSARRSWRPSAKTNQQVIVPRKGVLELQRILGGDGSVDLAIGTNHVRAQIGNIRFTSKLIDGRFPEYGRVIPANPTKQVEADREGLRRQALQRTAILSNEKYRGVRLNLKSDLVTIQAHNPEQEEAEDQVEVTYRAMRSRSASTSRTCSMRLPPMDTEKVVLGLTDGNSSCLVRAGWHDQDASTS